LPGLYDELHVLDERIQSLEERIRAIFRSNDLCQKIAAVEGVGPVIVTAIVAPSPMAGHFGMGGSLRPGWDWCPDSIPAATSNECSESLNAAIRICACF